MFGLAQYGVHLGMVKQCEAARVGTTIGGPWFACAHFLYVALVIAAVTLAIAVVVSLLGAPPPPQALHGAAVSRAADGAGSTGVKRQRSPHVQMMDSTATGAAGASAHKAAELVRADPGAAPPKATSGPSSQPSSSSSESQHSQPAHSQPAHSQLAAHTGARGESGGAGAADPKAAPAKLEDVPPALGVDVAAAGAAGTTEAWVESRRGQVAVHVAGALLVVVVAGLVGGFA